MKNINHYRELLVQIYLERSALWISFLEYYKNFGTFKENL